LFFFFFFFFFKIKGFFIAEEFQQTLQYIV